LAADRRGVTAMMFAISAIAIIGFVGLGTEAGSWYLIRSAQDNAADAAACAAALVAADKASDPNITDADITDAATGVATQNGYTADKSITVQVNTPPASGNYAGNSLAAEVLISSTANPVISSIFSRATPTIASRAVAMVENNGIGAACVLSTVGDLNIWQSQGQGSQSCYYASNATDSTAVNVASQATVVAYGITSVGSCNGAGCSSATTLRPSASYQPPSTNPYTAIDAVASAALQQNNLQQNYESQAAVSDLTCQYGQSLTVTGNYTMVPAPANGTYNAQNAGYTQSYTWTTGQQFLAYENMCVNIQPGATVTFMPGTYIFYNASLTMNGGTIQCLSNMSSSPGGCGPGTGTGVSIILIGSSSGNVGTLTIGPGASVTLGALPSQTGANSSGLGAGYTAFNGILFYRAGMAAGENVSAPGVNINGGASTTLNGGMYFPQSYVSYGANGNAGPTCSILVGANISLTNTASQFGTTCSDYGTAVPQVQAVRLVE
jgi:Flp pilus assembly protein TadG